MAFSDISRKKRKKLHGVPAATAREVLAKLYVEQCKALAQQHDAFLCHVYDGKLVKYGQLKDELGGYVSRLDSGIPGPRLGEKRPADDVNSQAKKARIEEASTSASTGQQVTNSILKNAAKWLVYASTVTIITTIISST